MRTTTSPFVFLLLLSLATKPFPGATRPDPVLDTSGEEVRAGVPYYILPVSGSSFALAAYENDTCPLLVIQRPFHYPGASPVTFSPANPEAQVIHTSMNLNIKFTGSSICANSMVWRLLKRISEALFVSTDGVEGNPGPNTLVNWFTIEKDHKRGYKLRFCPTDVCQCSVTCSDLGIYVDEDKKRYLGLADNLQPISVAFKRAEPEILMMTN